MERKLAAILSADVKGYSRLMGDNEEETVQTLTAYREVMGQLIRQYRGRVVDSPGDNLLAEFASVVDAVQCAVAIQQALKEQNVALADHRKMAFRIGINLGDVLVEEERLYGDGINIAARLEELAEAGGICLSGTAYDQVKNKLDLAYVSMGEQAVKNIADPVRVYQIQLEPETATAIPVAPRRRKRRRWRRTAVVVAVLLAVAGILFQRGPLRSTLPLPDKPAIAVLPFHNFSSGADQDYFADGMTEDLITDLSKIASLYVIARNSVFAYKGQHVPVQQVAQELGVRYVLEGSVRRLGDEVRINAQLIDAETNTHVWAERYDRKLQDIFDLQDEVTTKIVTALAVTLTDTERSQLARRPTDNTEAYDVYLRAEQARRTWNSAGFRSALSLYAKAIALDPSFAEAYAGDAWVAWEVWRLGRSKVLPANVARKRADQSLAQAMRLKSDLPLAHVVMSQLHLVDRQYDAAVAAATQTVALDPHNAEVHSNLAHVLIKSGRPDDALQVIEKALKLNPKPWSSFYMETGWALFYLHQYERAIAQIRQATDASPASVALALAANYAQLERLDEAQSAIATLRKHWPAVNVRRHRHKFGYFAPDVLAHFMAALRKAGLPEWPYGYDTERETYRLDETDITQLVLKNWRGVSASGNAYSLAVGGNGQYVWRSTVNGEERVRTGTASVEDGMYCLQSPQIARGEIFCGPVYRHPEGTPEAHNEYAWLNMFNVYYFSVIP